MPTEDDRKKLFIHFLNNNHTLNSKQLNFVSRKTEGYSCSDIEKIVATAATFFYQDLYSLSLTERHSKCHKGRKITFEELIHVVDKSSPSINFYQLNDSETFKQKHNFVKRPEKKEENGKKSRENGIKSGENGKKSGEKGKQSGENGLFTKKGFLKRVWLWPFGN